MSIGNFQPSIFHSQFLRASFKKNRYYFKQEKKKEERQLEISTFNLPFSIFTFFILKIGFLLFEARRNNEERKKII